MRVYVFFDTCSTLLAIPYSILLAISSTSSLSPKGR